MQQHLLMFLDDVIFVSLEQPHKEGRDILSCIEKNFEKERYVSSQVIVCTGPNIIRSTIFFTLSESSNS